MKELRENIEMIVNKTIEENKWDKLSSTDYGEFLKVTEIGEKVTFKGKKITGAEVTDILEELGICERKDSTIKLTEEGKKYGRYVISIHISDKSPHVTDKGYAKYKIEVKDLIEKFIFENPQFLLTKREERIKKSQETKKKNKALKENNKEATENEER